jgi:hypothetical protein
MQVGKMGNSLPARASRLHDGSVGRVTAFLLALVVLLWLPVRPPVPEPEPSHPKTHATAQIQQPSGAPDVRLQVTPGAPRVHLPHGGLLSQLSSSRLPNASHSSPVRSARLRIHVPPLLRAFPLLI